MGLTGVYDLHLLKAIAIGTDVDARTRILEFRVQGFGAGGRRTPVSIITAILDSTVVLAYLGQKIYTHVATKYLGCCCAMLGLCLNTINWTPKVKCPKPYTLGAIFSSSYMGSTIFIPEP